MKIRLLFIGLFFSLLTHAQIQDLATMAEGKIVYNTILYDSDDNLYGYLYIYERNTDSKTKTMEYVFLDKNLNKVSNTTFTNNQYNKVFSKYYDCTLMGDYVILNKYYYYINGFTGMSKPLIGTFQLISLKDNTVSEEFKYENGVFTNFVADFDEMKKEYKGLDTRSYVNAFNNGAFKGFFISEDNAKKSYLEKDLKFFNEKKELVWKFEYNPNGSENNYNTYNFLFAGKNTIYIAVSNWAKDLSTYNFIIIEYKIVALDMETGKVKYNYVFENPSSEYSHTMRVKEINNQLVLAGNYSPYKKTDFSLDQNLGFYRIKLDESGNEIEKTYTKWADFADKIDVDKRGRVEKNYRLKPLRYYFMKDGSISILTEKYKFDTFGSGLPKITDYVLFNMKPDFTPLNVNIIKKEVSYYYSNYLFSQYINDETGVVFFYYDVDNKKSSLFSNNTSIQLGINTIIDGKLTEEKIPLNAKKKFFIQPNPAKEGYIMLREYNEKEEYNQIRLEKLNY